MLEFSQKFKNFPEILETRSVSDFWRWAFSDLLQNTTRGVLAEYMVAVLLGVDNKPRNPWESFDIELPDGRRVEVKTMSHLQAWGQKQLSVPRVVLSPKRFFEPETGRMESVPSLNADLYIICYFTAVEHSTANTMDIEQWRFFVLTRIQVESILRKTKSVSLKMLEAMKIKKLEAAELTATIASLKR
jgi:hypothetical protein